MEALMANSVAAKTANPGRGALQIDQEAYGQRHLHRLKLNMFHYFTQSTAVSRSIWTMFYALTAILASISSTHMRVQTAYSDAYRSPTTLCLRN